MHLYVAFISEIAIAYKIYLKIVLCITVASNVLYNEFEKAFAGQIINPCDLLIKEKIGEGE